MTAIRYPTINRPMWQCWCATGAVTFADATLRPAETMSRARACNAIARLLESRNLPHCRKARPSSIGG